MFTSAIRRAFALALVLLASPAFAQGLQTGTLTGRVTAVNGAAIPSVLVTVTSTDLLGERSTQTDVNGTYRIEALPPGLYVALFEVAEDANAPRVVTEVVVPLGGTAVLDQVIGGPAVEETVVVTADGRAATATPALAFNQRIDTTDRLPIGRTPAEVATLAPGVTDNTPNSRQAAISGGFAFDNVFLVDGVDVNDNVLGNANELFIEDAIEETQVLAGGAPAEFGRFSGGVVNVITRSGGNDLSGTFRVNLSNPTWSAKTPLEVENNVDRESDLSTVYEGTFGGPLSLDRVWFFVAGRAQRSTSAELFPLTGVPFTRKTSNDRFQVKLSASLAPGHTVSGTYLNNGTDLNEPTLPFSIDPSTIGTPTTENSFFVGTYNGLIAQRYLAEVQYSRKHYGVRGLGGSSSAIVDSPFITRTIGTFEFNAPFFDGSDPEDRDNQQLTASLSTLVSSEGFGSHQLKVGTEWFRSTRVGANSQTTTGNVFIADFLAGSDGSPIYDASGRLQPSFVPGVSLMQEWFPNRGATADLDTTTLYLADRWTAGPNWTFDLGVRVEHVSSTATGASSDLSTTTAVPRLAASYSVPGTDGRTTLHTSYAHYAGGYNAAQFARNSDVGNSERLTYLYVGPPGAGRDYATGFDVSNYLLVAGTFPTANVVFDPNLKSPLTREWLLSVDQQIGSRGQLGAAFLTRSTHDFVEDFITLDGGQTTVTRNGRTLGVFDNQVYRNSDVPTREYQALLFDGRFQASSMLSVAANWTVQIKNDGNFEGEATSRPGLPSNLGDWPEVLVAARSEPTGRLDEFQRHKVRAWVIWSLDSDRFGELDIVPLYRYDSGLTYSLATSVPLSAIQKARDPGYARLPSSQTVYFGERGSGSYEGSQALDLAATYGIPVWESLRPWIKFEVRNLFDDQSLIGFNTVVAADTAGPVDADGLPTQYVKHPQFGQARGNSDYPVPRTFLMSFGLRF